MNKEVLVKEFDKIFEIAKTMKAANRFEYMEYYSLYCIEIILKILPLCKDELKKNSWNRVMSLIKVMLKDKKIMSPLSTSEVYKCMKHSVFEIKGIASAGTCFLVDIKGNDYYFMTNKHVVNNKKEFVVSNEDNTFEVKAKVVDTCKNYDLALLKATIKKPNFELVPVIFADMKNVTPGVPVNVVSNNGGLGLSYMAGYVANPKEDYILMNLSSQPGSSGSPIFDNYGSVIAIHVGKLAEIPFGINANVVETYIKSFNLKTKKQVLVKY